MVVGFSMGCFLAQHLAATSRRVAALVCVGGQGPRKGAVVGAKEYFQLAARTLHQSTTDEGAVASRTKLLTFLYGEAAVRAEDPRDLDAFVAQNLRFKRSPTMVRQQLRLLGSADPPLHDIKCPCLCLTGAADAIVPKENSARLAAALSCETRVVVVPGGHLPWGICAPRLQTAMDDDSTPAATKAVAQAIRDFLDDRSKL